MLYYVDEKYVHNLQAKEIFEKICPDEEFIPKAPNPEDIIYDDGEKKEEHSKGFELEAQDKTVCDDVLKEMEDKNENT